MIYYIVKNVEEPGFDGQLLEVVGIKLKDKMIGTAEFLADPENFRKASAAGQPVHLVWLPSMTSPVLAITADVQNPEDYKRVDDVYQLVQKYYDAATKSFDKNIIRQLEEPVSQRYPDDAKQRIIAVYAQILYTMQDAFDGVLNVSAEDVLQGDFFIVTNSRVQEHNNKHTSVFKSLDLADNVTLYQDECNSELFIEIPSRNVLLSKDSDEIASLVPGCITICNPYSDKNAFSPKYKEKGVPKHLIPMIEGNSSNNGLPVQENEQKYYKALMDWVAYNIQQEFDVSDDAIADGSATIDGISQEYLIELADALYGWHWSHNPNMPLVASNEWDSESTDNLSISSKYSFIADETKDGVVDNALLALNSYLEEVSAQIGYRAYVEAVIQLARWGSRKPTAIMFDGYQEIFDLVTNRVRYNIGSISDYSLKTKDGCQYELTGVINLDSEVADNMFGVKKITAPVGIVTTSYYTKGEDTLRIPTYFSMFDAVSAIKDGSLKISNISFDGLKFRVDHEVPSFDISLLVSDYETDADQFLQNPFSRSAELKDLCIEFGAVGGESRQNLMCILNDAVKNSDLSKKFEKYRMHDVNELQQMIMSGIVYSPQAVLIANIAKITLPVLLQVTGNNLTEYLNSWNEHLAGWKGIRSFFVGNEEKEQNEPSVNSSMETGAKQMNVFGKTEQTVGSDVKMDQPSSGTERNVSNALIRAIPPNAQVKAILSEDGEEIIGGYVRDACILPNGKKSAKFIIFDKATWDATDPSVKSDASVKIHKLYPYFVDDLTRVVSGHIEFAKLLFTSVETIHWFTMYFKNLSDKKEKDAN